MSCFCDSRNKLNLFSYLPLAQLFNNFVCLFIQAVNETFFSFFVHSSGFDPEGFKNVLLVTDGLSNIGKHMTLFKAFNLKNAGVEIFVVGVGGFTFGIQEIIGLASSTDRHLFRVQDFDGLIKVTSYIPGWNSE